MVGFPIVGTSSQVGDLGSAYVLAPSHQVYLRQKISYEDIIVDIEAKGSKFP